MDRLACVDLPSLPLQLLLRKHPEFAGFPCAVVAEDRPQGVILQIDERARAFQVLPGMRYAAGLSLAPGLRAAVIDDTVIEEAVSEIAEVLRTFSPNVEPCRDEPGVFWLDARGLDRLWTSLPQWGAALTDKLLEDGWDATVVVGFSRFLTYAVARTRVRGRRRLLVIGDQLAERRLSVKVPLTRLGLEAKARDGLTRLGISTVGDLLELPSSGVMRRFGPEAARLWRLARGDAKPRMRPKAAVEAIERTLHLDHGAKKASVLLFVIKRLLGELFAQIANRHEVLTSLTFTLKQDDGAIAQHTIKPAAPTLQEPVVLDLVRLRLDAIELSSEVLDITVAAETTDATSDQLRMYFDRPRRDRKAAHAALARLRAELGDDAVLCAKLKDGHLPQASYSWVPIDQLPERAVRPVRLDDRRSLDERCLVRRIFPRPVALPPQSRHVRDDGWLINGLEYGSVVRSSGPYLVSGGWWRREVHREYQYAETQRGDILWVYYDRIRRRWYLHGVVQ